MQRFFISRLLGKDVTITELSFVHQISRVLRSDIGDRIVLFNGDGQEYVYTIRSISKKEILLSLESVQASIGDSRTYIRLYQALPNKYDKIEHILQKGVEVGISEFIFFRSERSQRLAINARKMERFEEIAREAAEQCGGNKVPSLAFQEGNIPVPGDGQSYVLHTEGEKSRHIRDIDTDSQPVNIFIGPEGGWSPTEISSLEERGAQKIHLGERILRTETAGPVAAFFLIQK